MFRGFRNYASRLILLKYSLKPHEVRFNGHKWTRTSRADLTSSSNEEKPSIKPYERQGFRFLLTYSAMTLIFVRMSPA